MLKKRARADADKRLRRRDILRAAAQAFAEAPLSSLTMTDVARRAGLAKGTIYAYFASKEALFLQLVTESLAEWFAAVEAELQRAREPLTAESLAGLLARTLAADSQLTRLLTVLHPVLEENIDDALALEFKRRVRDQLVGAGLLLERRCRELAPASADPDAPPEPVLGPGDGVRFLLDLDALVIGLHAMATPSAAVARVLALPELAPMRVDFAAELQLATTRLLRGWHEPRAR
ncbi:MAG: TetR family transcriptional regulator [Myxococcales bacterium]|nr:TetR family transcriptional regulator [Myxococcales bacterium]